MNWERAALVLGGGAGIWDDLRQLEDEVLDGETWGGLVCAVNDVGAVWPRELHHWVSLHPEKLPRWMDHRLAEGHPMFQGVTWSRIGKHGVDRVIKPRAAGSSGFLGIQAMRLLPGIDRVVIVGMPMTPTPHFQESLEHCPGRGWTGCAAHVTAWRQEGKWLAPAVRSLSGWTREFLGAPTREWLVEPVPANLG